MEKKKIDYFDSETFGIGFGLLHIILYLKRDVIDCRIVVSKYSFARYQVQLLLCPNLFNHFNFAELSNDYTAPVGFGIHIRNDRPVLINIKGILPINMDEKKMCFSYEFYVSLQCCILQYCMCTPHGHSDVP